MSDIELFRNDEFRLDVLPDDRDGFRVLAPGLARALSVRDAPTLLRSIPDEEQGYALVRTPGGEQRVSYVTEAGFYRALGQRQTGRITDPTIRATVERFQTWVYRDVLPAIRRGTPTVPTPRVPQTLSEALRLAADEHDARLAAEQRVAELEPAARSWETLTHARGDYLVADAAKILSNDLGISLGQKRLFALLDELRWIYRAGDRRWRAYQSAIEAGRLSEVVREYEHPNDPERLGVSVQVRVTPKGLGVLHTRLADRPPLALVSADS